MRVLIYPGYIRISRIYNVITLSQKVRNHVLPGDASRKGSRARSVVTSTTLYPQHHDSWKEQAIPKCGNFPGP